MTTHHPEDDDFSADVVLDACCSYSAEEQQRDQAAASDEYELSSLLDMEQPRGQAAAEMDDFACATEEKTSKPETSIPLDLSDLPSQEYVDQLSTDYHLHLAAEVLWQASIVNDVSEGQELLTKADEHIRVLQEGLVVADHVYLSKPCEEVATPEQLETWRHVLALRDAMRRRLEPGA